MYYNQYAYHQQPVYGQYTNYQNYYYNYNSQQIPSFSYYRPTYPQTTQQPTYQIYANNTHFQNSTTKKQNSYKDEYLTGQQMTDNTGSSYAFNVSNSTKNVKAAALPLKKRNTSDKNVNNCRDNYEQNCNYSCKQNQLYSTPQEAKTINSIYAKPQPVQKSSSINKAQKIDKKKVNKKNKRNEEKRIFNKQTKIPAIKATLTPLAVQPKPYYNNSYNDKQNFIQQTQYKKPLPQVKANGLTATEDVDRLLARMGYSVPLSIVETESHVNLPMLEKKELMSSYGLNEEEFNKAEDLFKSHCNKGKFEIKNLIKMFPNNSLAERIQFPETTDDGDFLKFEEYLNIYQILKDLDI